MQNTTSFRKGARALSAVFLSLAVGSTLAAGAIHIAPSQTPAAAGVAAAVVKAANTATLPSGVAIVHQTIGTGVQPTANDTVRVHYTGKLENGTVFDSSVQRGTPASFPLNGVIPCWTQALQHIKVGGKATLTCPANTAYGDRGAGGVIPPGAKLTFEVELLAVQGR